MRMLIKILLVLCLAGISQAAQVIRYIDPDAAGAGTGVDWANAFTSQSAFNGGAYDLTAAGDYVTVYCRSSGGTDDTTAYTLTGWNTGVATYIEFIGSDFPATGIFDATKYLYIPNNVNGITISEKYVRFINIQFSLDVGFPNTRNCIQFSVAAGGSDIRFDSCIFKAGTIGGVGRAIICSDADVTATVYNSTIYGWTSGFSSQGLYISAGTMTAYNCTIYGCNTGFYRTGGTATATNCISGNNTDDFSATVTCDYCASDDGDGTNAQAPSGGSWTNEMTDPANGDFSLLVGGNCVGNGTDNPGAGLYSDDIIGTARSSTWDIGAFEYSAGGGGGGGGQVIIIGMN